MTRDPLPYQHFVVIFANESNDPRPIEEYQLVINVLLFLKVFKSESAGELAFHLDLKFLNEVNATAVSDAIDAVRRDFHVEQSDVRLFVHDSPPYMVAAVERFKSAKGYSNCVHLPCWPHLLAKVPKVAFDGAYLPELKEFHRLIQLLFAPNVRNVLHVAVVQVHVYPDNVPGVPRRSKRRCRPGTRIMYPVTNSVFPNVAVVRVHLYPDNVPGNKIVFPNILNVAPVSERSAQS